MILMGSLFLFIFYLKHKLTDGGIMFSDLKWDHQNTAYLLKTINMTTAWTLNFTAMGLSVFNTNINSIVLCSQFPFYLLHLYYPSVTCLWCRLFLNCLYWIPAISVFLGHTHVSHFSFNLFCPQNFIKQSRKMYLLQLPKKWGVFTSISFKIIKGKLIFTLTPRTSSCQTAQKAFLYMWKSWALNSVWHLLVMTTAIMFDHFKFFKKNILTEISVPAILQP